MRAEALAGEYGIRRCSCSLCAPGAARDARDAMLAGVPQAAAAHAAALQAAAAAADDVAEERRLLAAVLTGSLLLRFPSCLAPSHVG
jgi:hypothetical protein